MSGFPWHLFAGRFTDQYGHKHDQPFTAWNSQKGSYANLDGAIEAYLFGRRLPQDNRPHADWGEVLCIDSIGCLRIKARMIRTEDDAAIWEIFDQDAIGEKVIGHVRADHKQVTLIDGDYEVSK